MGGNRHITDHIDSDEMDGVLEWSREQYQSLSNSSAEAGPSRGESSRKAQEPSYLRKHALKQEVTALDTEITSYRSEIKRLEEQCALREGDKRKILKELKALDKQQTAAPSNGGQKGKGRAAHTIDYMIDFDWSQVLRAKMKKVFGISDFRLCQKGVCNANIDGRDIVCVMPTGGGKSLTYQLPALLTPGVTVVISPLIALITDQYMHLKEAGVEVVMLTSGVPKPLQNDCYKRLSAQANRRGSCDSSDVKEIKLVYVTPEKIAKSKAFVSILQKLYDNGKLVRIVIDEAHCVSQLGHDFRVDYQKLHIFKQYFPHTPIMALSATCPPIVLDDLIKTLKLKPVVHGSCASKEGTVYFSAPLYRKNLHYKVLPKPSSTAAAIRDMADYILKYHRNDSGIVYCCSKKDTHNIAEGLAKMSNNKILTGVYHSEVSDKEKEKLHKSWRMGALKVVCATIAFGLGIDKGDVRFVLHHSMSKSMDGFYQESGRAGRDGKDADCILYYRPQDMAKLASMVCKEVEGTQKLHDMLRFAQEMKECRKVYFAKYFSASSRLSMSSWSTDDTDVLEPCGHCDNCTRPPESMFHEDVTLQAWQILKIADAVRCQNGNLTLNRLGELARGNGGGVFIASGHGQKGKSRETFDLDLDAVAGGKVALNREDTEVLLVHLILSGYLKETFSHTPYNINVYIEPGQNALRLSRFSRETLKNGTPPKIECWFRKPVRKSKTGGKGGEQGLSKTSKNSSGKTKRKESGSKRKRPESSENEGNSDDEHDVTNLDSEDDRDLSDLKQPFHIQLSDGEDDASFDWTSVTRAIRPVAKRPRKSNTSDGSRRMVIENDKEILVLSSD